MIENKLTNYKKPTHMCFTMNAKTFDVGKVIGLPIGLSFHNSIIYNNYVHVRVSCKQIIVLYIF